MWKTVARRLLILIPQLLALSLVIFFFASLMPGDPFGGLMFEPDFTLDDIEALREALGLNRHWVVRYVEWLRNVIVGDLGRSLVHARPVVDVIGERAGNTLRLSLLSLVFIYIIAIPLGIVAGRRKDTFVDKAIVFYTFFALAMPTVIFAVINLWIFSFRLRWFPFIGSVDVRYIPGTLDFHLSRLRHLILPALTAALLGTVGIINFLRTMIIDSESSDFVTTARSKGVPERVIYNKHILKNASLPIVAGFGPAIAGLIGGNIFIEMIFSFPGMGGLFVSSIQTRDWPVANGLILIFAIATVIGILLGDLFMMILDPRIRIR
ncbi:MAG: ABC transporter permease [Defluviitaleaceae bacterium]|nr:ABC transporter permease [Defluviitaleaceae bacterium]